MGQGPDIEQCTAPGYIQPQGPSVANPKVTSDEVVNPRNPHHGIRRAPLDRPAGGRQEWGEEGNVDNQALPVSANDGSTEE